MRLKANIYLKVSPYLNIFGFCGIFLVTDKVFPVSLHFFHFSSVCEFGCFSINRRSLLVGTTEASASVELTTEGTAEGCTKGTFGRSLVGDAIKKS